MFVCYSHVHCKVNKFIHLVNSGSAIRLHRVLENETNKERFPLVRETVDLALKSLDGSEVFAVAAECE